MVYFDAILYFNQVFFRVFVVIDIMFYKFFSFVAMYIFTNIVVNITQYNCWFMTKAIGVRNHLTNIYIH